MNPRAIAALVLAAWRTALSYRLRFVMSMLTMAFMVVPLYLVSSALQPVMAPVIATEGTHYFAFVTLGLFASTVVGSTLTAFPESVSMDLNSGFFEAVVSTPTAAGAVAVGVSGYSIIRHTLRGSILVLAGAVFGINLVWSRLPEAFIIVALIILAHFGISLIAGAFVIAFRTTVAIPQAVLVASGLLGGVYYPTSVIPSWIQRAADAVPLSYGLRALRHTLLDGRGIQTVLDDVGILLTFATVLLALGAMAYRASLYYARQAGSLSQY